MRKLLPYEHQLIEALGITKEEYLKFVAIQREYKDPKAGTALDVRNEVTSTTALVLTVVGILFQVGAALLAPKPEIPDIKDRQRRNREQRFAPTFGFNSTQELASYGDPVNLVYTNENPVGDVRVSGSLVWSAVENFGSTQFMQLMLALGASKIVGIDFTKTAFGQATMIDLDKESVFIFAKEGDGNRDGSPAFKNRPDGFANKAFFPERLKPGNDGPACSLSINGDIKKGFSQAYSPSTSTSLGVFDAIPINVLVKTRDREGDRKEANIGVEMRSNQKQNNKWLNRSGSFSVGDEINGADEIQLLFQDEGDGGGDKNPRKSGEDMRRQFIDALDFGSTYMLGTAKFRLLSYATNARSIDEGEVKVNFRCIAAGQVPSASYDTVEPIEEAKELRREYEEAKLILPDTHTPEVSIDKNTETQDKHDYVFTAEEFNEDDPETIGYKAINITETGIVDITFNDTESVEWYPTVTIEFELEDGTTGSEDYEITTPSKYTFPRRGSIAFTQALIDELNSDKPVLKTKRIKKSIRRQIKALRDLIDDVNEGVYDGGDELPWRYNSYQFGTDSITYTVNGKEEISPFPDFNINGLGASDLYEKTNGKFETPGYRKSFIQVDGKDQIPRGSNKTLFWSFCYIDRENTYHFFNFNGLAGDQQSSEEPLLFPNDTKLNRRREKLADAEGDLQRKNKEKGRALDQSRTLLKSSSIDSGSPTQTKSVLNKDTATDLAGYDQDISDLDITIEKRRNKVDARIKSNFEKMHKFATDIIKEDIDFLEALKENIPTENETDREGTKLVRKALKQLKKDKEAALDTVDDVLANWKQYQEAFDNSFFSKCLVKAETATYETLSLCNAVKFSLKSRLFRRISGREKRENEDFTASDNGVKSRMVFFRVIFSIVGTSETTVPYVFAIRHGSDADFYSQLGFYSATQQKWKFRFEPVYDMMAEYGQRPFDKIAFLENTDKIESVVHANCTFFWTGSTVDPDPARAYYPNEIERGPIETNEWDMFSVDSDTQVQFSFESGPEIALTAVTEQQVEDPNDPIDGKYSNITMMALGVFAGRGIQDLRNVSTMVTEGKTCRKVEDPGAKPDTSSSYAPDIFVDTVLDPDNGIGKYVEAVNVDTTSLSLAKSFCKNNNLPLHAGGHDLQFFMDGIIADVGSWREFWVNNAPFSLLELARKNGTDTLVPALPCNNSGRAAENSGVPIEVPISALFTPGNILEGSYKEEFLNYGTATEDIIASVIYRKYEATEIFSTKSSVDVRLADTNEGTAIRETFDLSQFVTQREQAIMFGKLLCNQRRYIRKGVEFKTFPSQAVIEPGDFVFVDIGLEDWDGYSTGMVMENGELNTPLSDAPVNGTYEFLFYKPDTGEVVKRSSVTVTNNDTAFNDFAGYMFVMGTSKPYKRVYRVTEIAIEEEGEVAIKAVEYPCFEESGKLRARIADFRASNFTVS